MINVIKSICKFLSPKFHSIHLEYKVNVIPRYGHGKPAHDLLHEIINQNRKEYENNLNYFMNFSESIQAIKNINHEDDKNNPTWNNGFLPGLDIIGI